MMINSKVEPLPVGVYKTFFRSSNILGMEIVLFQSIINKKLFIFDKSSRSQQRLSLYILQEIGLGGAKSK